MQTMSTVKKSIITAVCIALCYVLPLIVPIFLSAFKRADELAMAMEARGYRGARGRTRKKSVPLPLSSWGALALCALVCAAEILL